ncbi:MAG: hypothetical protein AB7O97_02115 [Planctomycetota bacterium]
MITVLGSSVACALAGASLLLTSWGHVPVPADCLISGPHYDMSAQPTAPEITDEGTTSGTNNAGCDGCTVNMKIKITWHHNGKGYWTVNGVQVSAEVTSGSTTEVTVPLSLPCGNSQGVSAENDSQEGGSMSWTCNDCQ